MKIENFDPVTCSYNISLRCAWLALVVQPGRLCVSTVKAINMHAPPSSSFMQPSLPPPAYTTVAPKFLLSPTSSPLHPPASTLSLCPAFYLLLSRSILQSGGGGPCPYPSLLFRLSLFPGSTVQITAPQPRCICTHSGKLCLHLQASQILRHSPSSFPDPFSTSDRDVCVQKSDHSLNNI